MTRTFSYMAVIVAALAVSVPAAFGDSWGADRQSPTALAGMPDVVDRALAQRQQELGAASESGFRDHFVANDNRFSIDPTTQPVLVSVTGSGDDLEWTQIGIGLGAGILLAFGLVLGLRLVYVRPLAH